MTAVQTNRHGSPRTRRRRRLFLALSLTCASGAIAGLTTGCQTANKFATNSSAKSDSWQATAAIADWDETPSGAESTIQTVAFDDVLAEIDVEQISSSETPPPDFDVVEQTAGITLEAIEAIALANNPTIAELVATTQKAAGFRTQVGLRANPTLGYNAAQLADQGTDQHTVFISQTIITGDKLALNRSVLNEALRAQLMQLESQKYRIATDIRVAFYEALAAQRRVELIRDFQSVADKGVDLAEQLKAAQEGSQLEIVQAKVQKNEIDLSLRQAQVQYEATWRELAALAGNPNMAATPLVGSLPKVESTLDWSVVASTMIASSPEIHAAQARINQARANLCRQQVQPIPNLDVQFASGYDNGTNSGLINLQVGAPIPVFNMNQGNISAARSEYARADRERQRVEHAIKARLASVSRDYDSSLIAVEQYASDILPNAADGLNLAELAYRAGETNFVQVLVARRTYFDTNLQYIVSQRQLAQARARVDGYVLTGALDAVFDGSGDDSLRGLTFSQQ